MHIPRKNDQYFYFSDVPDVRSKRFWTDTTSSFRRWPKTLQLCPALVAFQKSTFETSATRLLSQPFSPRRCLATFFSARSPICVKLSRCTIILLKLQTSNWAHSCLEHTPFRGRQKQTSHPEPRWWRKPSQRCVESWLCRPVFSALVNCPWTFCNQDFISSARPSKMSSHFVCADWDCS